MMMFDFICDARPIKRLGQTSRSIAKEHFERVASNPSGGGSVSQRMCLGYINNREDKQFWLDKFRKLVAG